MAKKVDIHGYGARLGNVLKQVKRSKKLSKQDREDILAFADQCAAEGISTGRILKYVYHLRTLSKLLRKSFRNAEREDVMKLVGKLEQSDYREWTKKDFKVLLKKFYKWMRGTDEYPEEVKWIRTTMKSNEKMLPEQILTEEEIGKIAGAADNPRDRALVLVLYESGCRIGELLTLRIKHVQFDDYGAVLILSGKTGMRRVRAIGSATDLKNWINAHPFKDDPEAFIWIQLGNRNKFDVLGYAAANQIFRKLAERAKVKKKVNPHAFRHARATHLADKLTEAQLKELFGWVQGSKVASMYVHLSGRDLDDALLKLHGLSKVEAKKEKFKLRICPRCKTKNSPTAKYCAGCSLVLDVWLAEEDFKTKREGAGRFIEWLFKDPEVREIAKRKIGEIWPAEK